MISTSDLYVNKTAASSFKTVQCISYAVIKRKIKKAVESCVLCNLITSMAVVKWSDSAWTSLQSYDYVLLKYHDLKVLSFELFWIALEMVQQAFPLMINLLTYFLIFLADLEAQCDTSDNSWKHNGSITKHPKLTSLFCVWRNMTSQTTTQWTNTSRTAPPPPPPPYPNSQKTTHKGVPYHTDYPVHGV